MSFTCTDLGDVLQVLLSDLQSDGLTFSVSRERQRRQTSMGNQIPRINLPPSLFGSLMSPNVGVFFTFYATPIFFPLAEGTRSDIIIGTPVIGATVANVMFRDLEENVTVVFQLQNTVSNTYIDHCNLNLFTSITMPLLCSCRLWRQDVFHGMKVLQVRSNLKSQWLFLLSLGRKNHALYCLYTDGMGNWTTEGCVASGGGSDSAGIVTCSCNHLTNFAVQVVSHLLWHDNSVYIA